MNLADIILILGVLAVITIIMLLTRRTVIRTLIIVGNGFDLYHGIPSSYLRFRDYVKEHDNEVFLSMEKYLHFQGDDQWYQLEQNLANLDPDDLLMDMRIHLGDPSGDWKDSMYYEFQYEVGRVTEKLGDKLQQLFLQWILQLDIRHQSGTPKLLLPNSAFYLNFNYTSSLEKLYKINARDILYIHGKAIDQNSSIVLGHAWKEHREATIDKPPTYEEFVDGDYATEEDWQMTEAKDLINNYFSTSYKNAPEIIGANENSFAGLHDLENIYVMGHSMSAVDILYFEAIAENIDTRKVKWTISYHKKDDVINCTQTLQKIGIDMKLVEFKLLQDFFSPQMNLFRPLNWVI